jgi:hypothetical protein
MKKVNLNFFTVEETECFIAVIPPSIFVALGALVTAFDLITITSSLNDHNWSMALFGWYNSVTVLVYFNIITQALYYGGKWTGEENYKWARPGGTFATNEFSQAIFCQVKDLSVMVSFLSLGSCFLCFISRWCDAKY